MSEPTPDDYRRYAVLCDGWLAPLQTRENEKCLRTWQQAGGVLPTTKRREAAAVKSPRFQTETLPAAAVSASFPTAPIAASVQTRAVNAPTVVEGDAPDGGARRVALPVADIAAVR
jgi:hypothetical protein